MTNKHEALRHINDTIYIVNGKPATQPLSGQDCETPTIAERVIAAHNKPSVGSSNARNARLSLAFDALISHDITYVAIIQTAKACGMKRFPLPYALTNCHNSLCAVGGTINEDDHKFGLSATVKYGGIYVPPNAAVIHQYARETLAKPGSMILGSDSHTRFGAFGCLGVGEGGGELVKQLLELPYETTKPDVVLVWLTGTLSVGVGPMDIALKLCELVYDAGHVKNKVLEFAGPSASSLSMDDRVALDVMTTETACLSSIWETDEKTKDTLKLYGREADYAELRVTDGSRYGGMIEIDLSSVKPMIALPFHPSKAVTIESFLENVEDMARETEKRAASLMPGGNAPSLAKNIIYDYLGDGGKRKAVGFKVDQGIIAGCAGGIGGNIDAAATILRGGSVGSGAYSLSVYPSSVPLALGHAESLNTLAESGAIIKPCFCGPCFGAGDTPAHGEFSIRHTTRNFPNREGSKPNEGQCAYVALMDARSIAATSINGGLLTAADTIDIKHTDINNGKSAWNGAFYAKRVYNGVNMPNADAELVYGPNIADWPEFPRLGRHVYLEFAAAIYDDVTTTDELIPSGETSSYRSNPVRLAQFTLSRREPSYVSRAKAIAAQSIGDAVRHVEGLTNERVTADDLQVGSCVFAIKPGDGSAREQAASCQKVLGGLANVCEEYATKRYRSNLINWGILPFTLKDARAYGIKAGDALFVPNIREQIEAGASEIDGTLIQGGKETTNVRLNLGTLSDKDRRLLVSGCLINDMKVGC